MPLTDHLKELLSASLDEVLSAEEQSELEKALASSEEARELLAKMRSDQRALRNLPKLAASPELRRRAAPALPKRQEGLSWKRRALKAASIVLVVGLFWYFRPVKSLVEGRLHLAPGRLVARAAAVSHELHLAARGAEKTEVMTSEPLSASYQGGPTSLHLHCDSGGMPNARLIFKLAFDFDGDGKYEQQTTETRELQTKKGYQEVVCTWPEIKGMQDLRTGRVRIEVSNGSDQGPPIKLLFDPDHARTDIPYRHLRFSKA